MGSDKALKLWKNMYLNDLRCFRGVGDFEHFDTSIMLNMALLLLKIIVLLLFRNLLK